MKGYYKRMAELNLVNGRDSIITLKEDILKKYIGGSGLGAFLMAREVKQKGIKRILEDPPLILLTGPLCGTGVPSSDRLQAISISPLTGIWGESDVGGRIGSAIRSCGLDGMIIKGRAAQLSYLIVQEDTIMLISAPELQGKDTYQLEEYFQDQIGKQFSLLSIGPAGENGVSFASIMIDGRASRALGRCGLGAVMGSKNLKSIIVVRGKKQIEIEDIRSLKTSIKSSLTRLNTPIIKDMRKLGTASGVDFALKKGNFPVKNWQERSWFEEGKDLNGLQLKDKFLVKRYYCGDCVIGCGREVKSLVDKKNKPVGGPEYETIGLLGSNLLLKNLDDVVQANELCNRYGLDTISTGNVIGLLFEIEERALLKNIPQFGSLHPVPGWGNGEKVLELIERIAYRQGIGDILARGTRYICQEYKLPEDMNIQVKGMEPPAHDPRFYPSLYLGYATSNRGACHLQGFTHSLEGSSSFPEIGYDKVLTRENLDGKALLAVKMQNIMCIYDSLKLCKYLLYTDIPFKIFFEWYLLVTGREISLEVLLETGDRIYNLKRMINIACGVTEKDDSIPGRFFVKSDHGISREDFINSLNEYYRIRGWKKGIPGLDVIKKLQLDEFASIRGGD